MLRLKTITTVLNSLLNCKRIETVVIDGMDSIRLYICMYLFAQKWKENSKNSRNLNTFEPVELICSRNT